jgi:hypothetical protein
MGHPLNGYRVLVIGQDFFDAIDITNALQNAGAQVLGPLMSVTGTVAQIRGDGFEVVAISAEPKSALSIAATKMLMEYKIPFVFLKMPLSIDDTVDAVTSAIL